MKPKKMQRKLQLNKKTVANLRNREMENLHGGVNQTLAQTNCPECIATVKTCSCAESACCPVSYGTNCNSLCSIPMCCY